MQKNSKSYLDYCTGDKIRMRAGDQKGQKGIVKAIFDEQLEIQLDDGKILHAQPQDVTNQSLAARKAWQTMRNQ